MYQVYAKTLWDGLVKRRLFVMGILWLLLAVMLSMPIIRPLFYPSNVPHVAGASIVDHSTPLHTVTPKISGTPSHIAFPRLNISVDVIPGYYNKKDNSWTLSSDKAQFATVTSEPNNKTGNTFIYGHNRWQVFTGLLNAKEGDEAVVTTSNNHTFTYTLRTIQDTDPTDLSYMQDHKSPILTVQTCSGLWYEHRRMLTFDLTSVDGQNI